MLGKAGCGIELGEFRETLAMPCLMAELVSTASVLARTAA